MTREELIAEIRKFDDLQFVIKYGNAPKKSTFEDMDREELEAVARGYWSLMYKILNDVVVID